MQVSVSSNGLIKVWRGANDKPIYKESTFWYYLVKQLRIMHPEELWTRVRPHKTYVLCSNNFGICKGNPKKQHTLYIDGFYSTRFINKDFNSGKVIVLLNDDECYPNPKED